MITTQNKHLKSVIALALLTVSMALQAQSFQLMPSGYFKSQGVDVMAFDDFYPEGHQGGVCVIMNGHRIATNGDIRMEATPGQWQPVPKQLNRKMEGNPVAANRICIGWRFFTLYVLSTCRTAVMSTVIK